MRKISFVANVSTNGAIPKLAISLFSFLLRPAQAPFAHYGPLHQAPTVRRVSAKDPLSPCMCGYNLTSQAANMSFLSFSAGEKLLQRMAVGGFVIRSM